MTERVNYRVASAGGRDALRRSMAFDLSDGQRRVLQCVVALTANRSGDSPSATARRRLSLAIIVTTCQGFRALRASSPIATRTSPTSVATSSTHVVTTSHESDPREF
jgi:hypothetical protein